MAIISGPTQSRDTFSVDGNPDQSSPDDANAAANAKAQAKVSAKKDEAHFQENIKDGRADEDTRETSLGRGPGLGVSSLALGDGVAQTGIRTLLQILSVPATAEAAPQEVDPKQALADFSTLQPLLGKPQGSVTEPLFNNLGPGALPLVPLGGQVRLVSLSSADFSEVAGGQTASASKSARTTDEASGASTVSTQADPEIVQRVQFVKRLSALMNRTLAAQLDPGTAQSEAQRLGQKSAGLLEPFAAAMPALKDAIQAAFVAMKAAGNAGTSDVEVPPRALSMIETAIGKAVGQSSAFVAQVKANSAQIAQVLQAQLDGNPKALSSAPPVVQKLVQGVVSWNDKHGDGSFPAATLGADTAGNQSLGTASSADHIGDGSDGTLGDPTQLQQLLGAISNAGAQVIVAGDSLASGTFSSMDIDALIMMVMTEGADEQTSELEDSLNDMQQNTYAKEAARQKAEALQQQQVDMKQQVDNEFYGLQAEGPPDGIAAGVTLTAYEGWRQIAWGDGVCDNTNGSYNGPDAQLPPLPEPLPGFLTGAKAASDPAAGSPASYGLSDAQLADLQAVYNSIQPPLASPADSFDGWLQAPAPTGLGLVSPISGISDATSNLSAAQKYLAANGDGTTANAANNPASGTPITAATLTDQSGPLYPLLKKYAELQAMTAAGVDVTAQLSKIQGQINLYLSSNPVDPALAKQTGGLSTALETEMQTLIGQAVAALQSVASAMVGVAGSVGNPFFGLQQGATQATSKDSGDEGFFVYCGGTNPDGTPLDYNASGSYGSAGVGWGSDGLSTLEKQMNGDNTHWTQAWFTGPVGQPDPNGMIADMQGMISGEDHVSYSGIEKATGPNSAFQLMASDVPGAPGSTELLLGLTVPVVTPSASTTQLQTQYNSAFGDPTDPTSGYGQQLGLLNGLLAKLPKNANGQLYDPGVGPPPGLTKEQEALLQQLVASGSLQLGPNPDQLAIQNQSAAGLQAFGAQAAYSALNHTGTVADMSAAVTDAQNNLDSLGDLTTDMQMRIQLEQSQYSQIMEALSNIMKKMSDTGQAIVENMKS